MKTLKALSWFSLTITIGIFAYRLITASRDNQYISTSLFLPVSLFLCLLIILWLWNHLGRFGAQPHAVTESSTQATSLPMVKLATIELHLDDPVDQLAFEQFLDQPLFSKSEAHASAALKTPSQIFEDAILSYIQEAEAEFNGTFSVRVNLHRGSFAIGLTFFAVYEFVAQYHDFVESIGVIRRQIRELVQDASKWYCQQTGRDISVRSHVSIEPSMVEPQGKDNPIDNNPPPAKPCSPTADNHNNQREPSNVNDVRINVETHNQSMLGTPLFAGLILIVVMGLASAAYCTSMVHSGFCLEHAAALTSKLKEWIR